MSGFGQHRGGRRPPPLEIPVANNLQDAELNFPDNFSPEARGADVFLGDEFAGNFSPGPGGGLAGNGSPLFAFNLGSPGYVNPYVDIIDTIAVSIPDKATADTYTATVIEDKPSAKFPFMCDDLLSEKRNPHLVSYLNRLLNKSEGARVLALEPMLDYRKLSKLNISPEVLDQASNELLLMYKKGNSHLKAFAKWLQYTSEGPLQKLKVGYIGQAGADIGGLRKEFMSNLAQEIKQKYCESVFDSPLICNIKTSTDARVSSMKLNKYGEAGPSINVEKLITGEAPSIISKTTSLLNNLPGLTTQQRLEKESDMEDLLRRESSLNSRLAMINIEKQRATNKHKRIVGEIKSQLQSMPQVKVAGSRRSSKKVGSMSVSGLAKTLKGSKNNNAQAVARLDQLKKEEVELREKLDKVRKEIRLKYASVYTANNATVKLKRKPTALTRMFDTIRRRTNASEPQRFNFMATSKTDTWGMSRIKDTTDLIANAIARHIARDCVITKQVLSFGLLRFPAVYIMALSSLCKPKSAKFGSIFELLSMKPSKLSDEQARVLCEVYNMCVKLDCETYDQSDEHVLSDASMKKMLSNRSAMQDYLKIKDAMYFVNSANKLAILDMFQSVYDILSTYVSIDSGTWKTNLNGMNLIRIFTPCFILQPSDILPAMKIDDKPIEQYVTRNDDVRAVLALIVEIIKECNTEDKSDNLRNFVRNVTGSVSPPTEIKIKLDYVNYASWMPIIVYHTCFNMMDLRMELIIKKMGTPEFKDTLTNYMFQDFSGQMSLA